MQTRSIEDIEQYGLFEPCLAWSRRRPPATRSVHTSLTHAVQYVLYEEKIARRRTYVVARLSVAAAVTSAHVDFGTGTRIFSMSSDFGTAFRCHGDVFSVVAAVLCGLLSRWLFDNVGL